MPLPRPSRARTHIRARFPTQLRPPTHLHLPARVQLHARVCFRGLRCLVVVALVVLGVVAAPVTASASPAAPAFMAARRLTVAPTFTAVPTLVSTPMFIATPGDGPVVPSPGSLTPGSPTGVFPASARVPVPASVRVSGARLAPGSGTSMRALDAGASLVSGSAAEETASLQQDLQDAQDIVDGFWRRHWTETFGGRYAPPAVLGPYDGANTATIPRCGARRLERDNAAYCPDGDYLAWDEDLMRDGYGTGDAWVFMVIAHEWAHAVQHRMPSALVSARGELQADCLAGAALSGAARDGALRAETGDRIEIDAAFHQIGDGAPWARPGDHGTAAQRIAEFARGGARGVRTCLP
ncbi:hypothetical protein [Actinomadura oligospora]|uniref:hypothetical protein n=1 Tax=Actinomadura oligospora TaxID=111804 RepID=UPI00068848DC|nr:hypothetical protein [Actinomadura oligospora]